MKRFFKFILTGDWFPAIQYGTIFLLTLTVAGSLVACLVIVALKLTGVIS